MNTYLLLRDNRETGPYTLEDLLSKGLKAYDLVWVRERSAAWRYPSEIDELKSFAPVVEEQPFDRFYKRPAEQQDAPTPALELAREADLARQADLEQKTQQEQWAEQAMKAQRARQLLLEKEIREQKSREETALREQKARLAAESADALRLQEQRLAIQAAEAAKAMREEQARQQEKAERALHELERKLQQQAADLAIREKALLHPAGQTQERQSASLPHVQNGQQPTISQPVNQTQQRHAPSQPARKVFVTMPAGNRSVPSLKNIPSAPVAPAQQEPADPRQPRQETIAMSVNERMARSQAKENNNPASELEKQMASYGNPGGSPASAGTVRFSQPLDEIKERYVQSLEARRNKQVGNDRWKKMARNAAVIAGLIGVGLLAGFMMRNGSGLEKPLATTGPRPVLEIPANVEQEAAMQDRDTPDGSAVDASGSETAGEAVVNQHPVNDAPTTSVAGPANTVVRESSQANPGAVASTGNKQTNGKSPQQQAAEKAARRQVLFDENKFARNNSITNPTTGERSKNTREDKQPADENSRVATPAEIASRPAPVAKNDWGGQVTVASNDYKKVAFGGIRNLQLTVTNHGKKALDQVLVELTYLKPSEEPLRSENVTFKNIEAGTSSTIRIPDTNRGIRVTYKIIQVSGAGSESVAGN